MQPPRQNGEPCPAALWETRPCFSGPCLTYEWVLRDGKVICERSDSEIVTGKSNLMLIMSRLFWGSYFICSVTRVFSMFYCPLTHFHHLHVYKMIGICFNPIYSESVIEPTSCIIKCAANC